MSVTFSHFHPCLLFEAKQEPTRVEPLAGVGSYPSLQILDKMEVTIAYYSPDLIMAVKSIVWVQEQIQ
jgi:hypothetical protein